MISVTTFEGYTLKIIFLKFLLISFPSSPLFFFLTKKENAHLPIMDVKTVHALRGQNVSLIPERRAIPVCVQVATLVSAQVRVY